MAPSVPKVPGATGAYPQGPQAASRTQGPGRAAGRGRFLEASRAKADSSTP